MKRFDVLQNIGISDIGFKGYGIGEYNGKEVHVWNALQGEVVDMVVLKKRRGKIEGTACMYHVKSKYRSEPCEDHFLSCSPWSILELEEEMRLKKELAKKQYTLCVSDSVLQSFECVTCEVHYGYRNKMEFSFCEDGSGQLSLAFIERGYKTRRIGLTSCLLAHDAITKTAHVFLKWLQSEHVKSEKIKSLIVRSNQKGETITGLFLKEECAFQSYPSIDSLLGGYAIYYSNPQSPISRADKLLYQQGQLVLNETICDIPLQYGLNSFFQVNIPLFEKVLDELKNFVVGASSLVDLYCGVGSIGIVLGKKLGVPIQFIEENEEARVFLKENCEHNNIQSYEYKIGRVELALSELPNDSYVILDPPRSGLHPKVIKILLEKQPKRIIYLSCNVETQRRDMALLLEQYKVVWCRAYNFFPRTPHIEGLCILDRIEK